MFVREWHRLVESFFTGQKLEDAMFNAKVLAVKSLMVLGKLLILLNGNIAHAETFSYESHEFANHLKAPTFGFFNSLNVDQLLSYDQAVFHAVQYAENGQAVSWYKQDASGKAIPVHTWPTGNGFCRRLHIETIAFNARKIQTTTVCFRNSSNQWVWVSDK
jgi:hypothetical protein